MPRWFDGKGAQAPFLFFGVLVSAWASSAAQAAAWHWALALALLAAAPGHSGPAAWTAASIAVAGFTLWALLHTVLLSVAYSPAGLYQPLFLLLGFMLGRRAAPLEGWQGRLGAIGWAAACISLYALVAVASAGGARAAAPFETPATLAAVTNLALLPILVSALWGERASLPRLVMLLLLFAGLMAAASRGAWLGLFVALGFAAACLRGRLPARRQALGVLAAFCAAAGLVVLARLLGLLFASGGIGSLAGADSGFGFFTAEELARDSSLSRLELYGLAFEAAKQHAPWGSGYLSFAQILEAGRQHVPSYGSGNVTFFVHNDYLQTLLELGLPGLLALLAIAMTPPWTLLRYRSRLLAEADLGCLACAAGLVSMGLHAWVDFPFFIPVCLLMFGLLLGDFDARCVAAGVGVLNVSAPVRQAWHAGAPVRRIVLALGSALLLVPLAAEWSAAYGRERWREGLGEQAAYGFEIARRLQPADWRYAWYAGQFWASQAVYAHKPEAARLADEAFARGVEHSPLEARNLIGRIALHRSLPRLLALPATPAELDAWSSEAVALAPRNPQARLERILVLERIGRIEDARREAAKLALEVPDDAAARFLAERLSGGGAR